MLRKIKRLIPAGIILFWLIMVGALLYREVALPYMYPGLTSRRVTDPQNIWLGLYIGEEQRVGFVNLRTSPDDRDLEKGYSLNVMARVEFPIFGQETRLQLSGQAWQSAVAGLRDFHFVVSAGDHEMRVDGVARDGVLQATLHTAGETIPFTLPVGREVLLAGGMGLNALSMPSLEPGQIAYVDTFDPTTMSTGRARIEALRRETLEVDGEPVDTVVITATISGMTTRAWVSENEEIIRAETPLGLVIKKISAHQAISPMKADESANLIRSFSVPVTGDLPLPDAKEFHFSLGGLDDLQNLPEDSRQRRENGSWRILRQTPEDRFQLEPLTDEERELELASDLFVQSSHPRIREAARDIVGDAEDDWEKAVRIHDWMFENITKEHVLSVPSALDVLEQRVGDCNEHAVLFTALARAVGIPTRIVIGLAWSRKMEAFGYHAWAEAHVGRWIAMDPTFGQRTVDPTHIKILTGGIEQWARLTPFIGAVEITTLGFSQKQEAQE